MSDDIKRRLTGLFGKKESGITLVLICIFIVLSITAKGFLTPSNLINIGRQVSILGIISAGMGLVMIAGKIDISVGSTYCLSAIITASVLVATGNTALALICGFAVGLIIGFINGFLVIKVNMPPFIATFGMLYAVRGLCLILTEGYPITLFTEGIDQETNPVFFFLGQGTLFDVIPMELVFMVLVFAIAGFVLHKTNFGIHIYAIGGSEKSSYVSGIKVDFIRYITYVITSLLAALAGILNLSFIGSIISTAGNGLEFEVFAAVVIGGVSMSGGEGSIFGMIVGVLVFGIIRNGLILLGIGQFWQVLIIGLITIGAVAYDSINSMRKLRRGE